jgi:hypothetical protein
MTTMTATHITYLQSLGACPSAIEFASDYSSLSEAYAACTKPEWLFWLAGHTSASSRQDIVLAACACARTVIPFATGPEALFAIETAEAWCRGEATIDQVRTAYAAAAAAGNGDDAYTFAGNAAYVAANAAYAVLARAAYAASYGTYAVALTAASRDALSANDKVTMCNLIRAIIPCPEVVCVE